MQTLAFQNDTSGFVSLIGYFGVLYASLADYFIFNVQLSAVSIGAAGIILFVTVLVSTLKIREGNRVKREQEALK